MRNTDPEPCPSGRPLLGEKVTPTKPSESAPPPKPVGPTTVTDENGRMRTTTHPEKP